MIMGLFACNEQGFVGFAPCSTCTCDPKVGPCKRLAIDVTEQDNQEVRRITDPQLLWYLDDRDAEGRKRWLKEEIQSVFSFGTQFHTWWFIGTGKPIPAPCERGCNACGPYWN